MSAVTRGRAIATAGFLAASTLLGTALAAGSAMQLQARPAPRHEVRAAMRNAGVAAPWDEATLAVSRRARPAPWDDAVPAPWEI